MIACLRALRALFPNHKGEEGQILLLVAGSLVVMLTFAALAIDIGFLAHTRREVQNDADAMALAGALELPDKGAAKGFAIQWATKNRVDVSEVESITFGERCDGTASGYDTITVRLKRVQGTFLASVIGVASNTTHVCATARAGQGEAGDMLLPFGFLEEDPYPYPGVDPNVPPVCYFYDNVASAVVNPTLWDVPCLIKIPQIEYAYAEGNSGALRMDESGGIYEPGCNVGSSGSSEYVENIKDGSECVYGIDDGIRPKTGNMRGPTCTAISNRLGDNTESLLEVFGVADSDGVHRNVDENSPRFGLVPIVSAFGVGSSAEVTITGFITVYIVDACTGPDVPVNGCNGNGQDPACVIVIPVRSEIFEEAVPFHGGSGGNPANNAIRTIKLID